MYFYFSLAPHIGQNVEYDGISEPQLGHVTVSLLGVAVPPCVDTTGAVEYGIAGVTTGSSFLRPNIFEPINPKIAPSIMFGIIKAMLEGINSINANAVAIAAKLPSCSVINTEISKISGDITVIKAPTAAPRFVPAATNPPTIVPGIEEIKERTG